MPYAAGDKLTPHFTARELGGDKPTANAAVMANLAYTAAWLENARAILGVPLRLPASGNGGYRTIAENKAAGGAPTSSHLTGLAADFTPVGMTQYQAWSLLKSASLPPFDQLEFDAVDGHIHVGLDPRARRQFIVSLSEGNYATLTTALASKLKGYTADAAAAVAAVPGGSGIIVAVLVVAFVYFLWPDLLKG